MNYPPHKVQRGWSYEAAEHAALELETLLRRHAIVIEPGSAMESHVLHVMKHIYDKSECRPSRSDDVRSTYRTLVGLHELANAVLAVQHTPSFDALLPHLRMLSRGSALQNIPSSPTDQVTNKLFELFAASLTMQCGSDVLLDDPESSKGDNPDVIATLCGRRWGIACKVIHGLNPEGFVGHLIKGIDQIEKSEAEVGAVLVNLKNVLPHESIWPLAEVEDGSGELATGCWSDPAAPYEILINSLNDLGDTLESYLPPGYLHTIFAGKKSLPGFLLWAHSVSGVRIDGRPTAASVRALNFRALNGVSPDIESALRCMNWAAFAGSPARGPKPPC